MILRRVYLLSDDQDAVIGQPLGLLVILIVASVIIASLCLSIPHLIQESRIQIVESEIDRILVEATNMFEYADNGSIVTIPVEFPSSMQFIVFGYLPRNGINEPTNLTLEEKTSNNYFYVMNDGTLRTFHSNARFSNRNMTQIVIFHSGNYDITLELCQMEGKTYVTMQQ